MTKKARKSKIQHYKTMKLSKENAERYGLTCHFDQYYKYNV